MASMIKPSHKGRLHAALGIPGDKPISIGELHRAMKSKSGHMRQMANFANNARKWGKKK